VFSALALHHGLPIGDEAAENDVKGIVPISFDSRRGRKAPSEEKHGNREQISGI